MNQRVFIFCLLIAQLVLLFISAHAVEDKLPFKVVSDPRTLPRTALIETTKGPIEIEFYREEAPVTVQNFTYLAKTDFYNNLTFHHFIKRLVIQGGDPLGTGKGGPGYTLPPEYSELRHKTGTIGMARFPSQVNVERRSNGSQFYICLSSAPHLDGMYTVFAHIISGMENARKLGKGDRIIRVLLPKNEAPR